MFSLVLVILITSATQSASESVPLAFTPEAVNNSVTVYTCAANRTNVIIWRLNDTVLSVPSNTAWESSSQDDSSIHHTVSKLYLKSDCTYDNMFLQCCTLNNECSRKVLTPNNCHVADNTSDNINSTQGNVWYIPAKVEHILPPVILTIIFLFVIGTLVVVLLQRKRRIAEYNTNTEETGKT